MVMILTVTMKDDIVLGFYPKRGQFILLIYTKVFILLEGQYASALLFGHVYHPQIHSLMPSPPPPLTPPPQKKKEQWKPIVMT